MVNHFDRREAGMATAIKGKKLVGKDRDKLAAQAVKLYGKGSSIRAIADVQGRSFGFVHRLLTEQGVALRGRGGNTRAQRIARQRG